MKKLFSALLVFTMLASLLPSVSLAGANYVGAGIVYEYNMLAGLTSGVSVTTATYGAYSSAKNHNWKYVGNSENASTAATWSYSMKFASLPAGGWVAFNVKAAEAGKYSLKASYRNSTAGGVAEFYVFGATELSAIPAKLTLENRVGSFTYVKAAGTMAHQVVGDTVLDGSGEYTIVMRNAGSSAAVFSLNYLRLIGASANSVMRVAIGSDKRVIKIGDTAALTAKSYAVDDTESAVSSASFVSSNPTVASVSGASVTALAEGYTDITCTIDGITGKKRLYVTASGDLPWSQQTENYNFLQKSSTWANPQSGLATDMRDIDYASTDGKWQMGPFSCNVGQWAGTIFYQGTGVRMQMATVEDWYSYEINVPAAGKYEATFVKSLPVSSGRIVGVAADVYIVPEGFDIESNLGADTKAGNISCISSGTQQTGVSDNFGAIDFPSAGKYYLVFKYTSGASYLNVMSLSLNGVFTDEKLESVSLSLPSDVLAMEGTLTAGASATLEGGDELELSRADVKYESLNAKATIDADSGVITPVSVGEAQIKVTVTFKGVSLSDTKTLTIKPKLVGSISIKAPDAIGLGGSFTCEIERSSELTDVPSSVTYSSTNRAIATVNSITGYVNTHMMGTSTIKAIAVINGAEFEAEKTINVGAVALSRIICYLDASAAVSGTQVKAHALGYMTDGSLTMLNSELVTFSNATGDVVTAGASDIEVTATYNSLTSAPTTLRAVTGTAGDLPVAQSPVKRVAIGDMLDLKIKAPENAAYALSTTDPSLAIVTNEGMVIPVSESKIGTVNIVCADSVIAEIAVVGKNLFNRDYINNGALERVSIDGESLGYSATDCFFRSPRGATGSYSKQQASLVKESTPAHENINAIKYHFDAAQGSELTDNIWYARLQSINMAYTQGTDDFRGNINLDKNKLYELSAWVKAENVGTLATDMGLYWFPRSAESPTAAIANSSASAKPWTKSSGNQDWTFVCVPAMICSQYQTSGLQLYVYADTTLKGKPGDFFMADFALSEVTYEKLELATESAVNDLTVRDKVKLSASHYTNTGNIIGGKNTDGTDVEIQISYESDTPSVAVVENSEIKAVGVGTARITAKATIGGVEKSAYIDVSVPHAAPPDELVSLELSYAKASIEVGDTNTPTISGKMTYGDDAPITSATVEYSIDKPDVAEIDATTGVVTAKAIGRATVTASVTLAGVNLTKSATVWVLKDGEFPLSGDKIVYDLDGRNTAWAAKFSDYENDIRGITYDFTDGKWQWESCDDAITQNYSMFYQYRNSYFRINMPTIGHWMALRLKVPTAGRYAVSFGYSVYASAGGVSDIYFMPVGTDVETAIGGDIYKIGRVNYYDGTVGTVTPRLATLDDVTAPMAGEYLIVFKQVDVSHSRYFFLRELKLNGAGPLDEATIDLGSNAIGVGTSLQAKLEVSIDEASGYTSNDVVTKFSTVDTDLIDITESGLITARANGIAHITAVAQLGEFSKEVSAALVIGSTKTRRSYYTDERIANALENIDKYTWAAASRNENVKNADKYLDRVDDLWNMVTTQELPRTTQVGARFDPNYTTCYVCKTDIYNKYGSSSWIRNPLSDPWKIQCPECKRRFPSNDFGAFYAAGLDENRNFRYEKAKAEGSHLLVNKLYPELGDEKWCVDDGYGFVTGDKIGTYVENKTFIAYYNAVALWTPGYSYSGPGVIPTAIHAFAYSYMHTGDAKYGRAGMILLDRVADVYPDFTLDPYGDFFNACGGTRRGKVLGRISEYNMAYFLAEMFDALWPATKDKQVMSYLSKKAEQYKFSNPKTSPELISLNAENNILRNIVYCMKHGEINSNFGHNQRVLAMSAVCLDTFPETKEWIDFIFKSGAATVAEYTGGNVYAQFIDQVDRDGHGNESAPAYNAGWTGSSMLFADILSNYDRYQEGNVLTHPKLLRMLTSQYELTCCSRYTPSIGDTGHFAMPYTLASASSLLTMWKNGYRDPNIAKTIYAASGENIDNIHYDMYTKDPESVKKEIADIVERDPEVRLPSTNLAGYGIMILRDGEWIRDAMDSRTIDTQRDIWVYYGRNGGHGHGDKMNLGLHAYGIEMIPDNGNPLIKTVDPNRSQWVEQPIAHNTVTVNQGVRAGASYSSTTSMVNSIVSKPLHFDDSGSVKVIDISAPETYSETSEYRRTVVMINANDDVSYALDFFRVKGGNDHIYSIQAQSNEFALDGVELVGQKDADGNYVGTYAGAKVPYGMDPLTQPEVSASPMKYPPGYTWMYNINRTTNPPAGVFSVDFKIYDNFKVLPVGQNLHLRVNILNDLKQLTEFSVVTTKPSQYEGVMPENKRLMARRSGGELDTLYTSVLEPYKDTRYISSIAPVKAVKVSGTQSSNDVVRAVKVTLVNGREDYIVYATNNTVLYKIDNKFNFRGIVGVYSLNGENVVNEYVNDGDVIGDVVTQASISGKVTGFSRELTTDNYIDVRISGNPDLENLKGRYIYVENGFASGVGNGCFPIVDIESFGSDNYRISLGNTTLIRSYVDVDNFSRGFTYWIADGQSFEIPLSYISDNSPVFDTISDLTADAASSMSVVIKAKSPLGLDLSYQAVSMPRGASYDAETQTLNWTPDSSQLGYNVFSIKATDSEGRETTYKSSIRVLLSTNGSGSGSIGGGATPPSGGDVTPPSGGTTPPSGGDVTPPSGGAITPPSGGQVGSGRFIDLAGYDWAKESIETLADKGIVNGVTDNTFAPGRNITRADFALMLVRALKLEGSAEQFADVKESDYFASDLIKAKASGVFKGIGNNLANPRGNITREEMFTLIARALKLESDAEITGYTDIGEISGYARSSISALCEKGYIQGNNGKISPKAFATRAEVAVLLDRILG